MHMDLRKILASLALTLLLGLTSVPAVYADELASPKYPDRPNVVWNVTSRETVVVHVLNTTPFNMELASSDFADYTANDPQVKDTKASPTAFTPSGIPHKIPAKTGASFVVSWLDTAKGSSNNDNNVLPDRNMAYTMKQVVSNWPPSNCPNPTTGDITVHMNFNRVKETQTSLYGDIFKLIVSGAALIVDSIEFIAEPINPIPLMGFLISAEEIAATSKEIADRGGSSDQVYFSAYVLPMSNSLTGNFPAVYNSADTSSSTTAEKAAPYDGLYSQHGPTGGGCPQAYIIPAVLVQRETSADDSKLNGNMPVVVVTLATSDDWVAAMKAQTKVTMQASSAGYRITQHLQRTGKKGQVAFIKLSRTLNHNEHVLFDNAYKAIEQKKILTHEEEAFLLRFAEALEKNASKLQPLATPSQHSLPARTGK